MFINNLLLYEQNISIKQGISLFLIFLLLIIIYIKRNKNGWKSIWKIIVTFFIVLGIKLGAGYFNKDK